MPFNIDPGDTELEQLTEPGTHTGPVAGLGAAAQAINESMVLTLESMRALQVPLVHRCKAPAFDLVLAPGKGTIAANRFKKVRLEDAGEPLELETRF